MAENRHSDCAEVAGIARYFRAICAHLGNVTALHRHQSSADSSSLAAGSRKMTNSVKLSDCFFSINEVSASTEEERNSSDVVFVNTSLDTKICLAE